MVIKKSKEDARVSEADKDRNNATRALATFAGGCFWCMVTPFEEMPGILGVVSGYTGGHVENPTYEEVCSETTGHAEAVQITYDPTDPGGQFHDRGESYRTTIYYHTEEQRREAEASKAELQASGRFDRPIVTPERQGVIRWESVPRRIVTLYLPLVCFLIVLLFPFYWMAITAVKSNEELYNYKQYNPFWVHSPTLANINKLLFETDYPQWLTVTMTVAVVATLISIFASVLAAYAIQRLRFRGSNYVGLAIYLAYLVPPSILFIPLATMVFQLGLFDSPLALILTYPTFLIPFCTWLLIGYFKSIPYELEECALIDGASRLQILWKITLPLAVPGLISAGIFAFTLSWNEFIYALAFIQSAEKKTSPRISSFTTPTGSVFIGVVVMNTSA